MSLQITTALAAGVFAMMFRETPTQNAKTPGSFPSTDVFWVSVIVLYTMLQLLLLANYLYHTFVAILSREGAEELELSQTDVKAIRRRLVQKTKHLNGFGT
jgi:hypothetical protein